MSAVHVSNPRFPTWQYAISKSFCWSYLATISLLATEVPPRRKRQTTSWNTGTATWCSVPGFCFNHKPYYMGVRIPISKWGPQHWASAPSFSTVILTGTRWPASCFDCHNAKSLSLAVGTGQRNAKTICRTVGLLYLNFSRLMERHLQYEIQL